MAPPIEYEVNFLPKTAVTIQKPQFGPLYNLKLELIENKKKLSRLLPPMPEWNKIKPTDARAISKPPSKESSKSGPKKESKPVVTETIKKVKSSDPPPQKSKVEEEESEDAGSEAEDESSDSEGEEEGESSESESEGEEEGESSESEGSDGSEDGSDSEDSKLEVSKDGPDKEKSLGENLTKEEMLKMGYTENIPPEELEKQEKEKYIKKYKLLNLRLRQKYETTQDKKVKEKLDRMIPLTVNDPLELIKTTYDDNIFELQVISSTQRYKEVAAIGFSGIEWLGKKFDEDLFGGYAAFQLSNMDQYEEVLMELGESSSILSEMTPIQKLMWMVGTNTAMFLIAKMSGNGSAALDVLSVVTGKTVTAPKAAPKIRLD